jgi:hypothetical protein
MELGLALVYISALLTISHSINYVSKAAKKDLAFLRLERVT